MAKDPYKIWQIRDFSKGQIEKLNDNILPDNAAYEMRNFISSRYGGLSKRKGRELLVTGALPGFIQGLHPFYIRASKIHKLVAMALGEIYIYEDGQFEKLVLEASGVVNTASGYATLTTSLVGDNNDLTYTAKAFGTGGNSISVAYIDPGGNDQALGIVVVGNAITVNLATGPAGAITSTATNVLDAIEASVDATALVGVALASGSDGTGVVTALTATNLTGGAAPSVTWVSGDKFNLIWEGNIRINGVDYEIDAIATDESMTLTSSAGTQSGVTYSYISGGSSILGHPRYPFMGTGLWGEMLFNEPDDAGKIFPLNSQEMVIFEDCVNYVIAMNGVDKPWKYDGTYFTYLANAPAKGRYPVLHKEKVFCVDTDDPSTLVWSDSFAPETWNPLNYWDIRKGDGDEITCILPFVGELLVFKQRSVHALKGTSLDDFALQEISSTIGCAGPRAAVVHDLKVFFLSERGLHITNGMNIVNISEGVIPDTWERVNTNSLHKATLSVWNNLIWISLPIDGNTVNNLTLVYDPATSAFFPMTGINASCYSYFDDGNGIKLYAGGPESGYVYIEDQGYDDAGTAIDAYWRGKYFDMGIPEVEKKSRYLYIQDSPNTTEIATVAVSADYGDYNGLQYYKDKGVSREFTFNLENNRWNYLSPEISHDGTGPCEIRGILISYKPKSRLAVRE